MSLLTDALLLYPPLPLRRLPRPLSLQRQSQRLCRTWRHIQTKLKRQKILPQKILPRRTRALRACVRYRAQKAYSRLLSGTLQRILQDLKLLYLSIPKILVSFRTGRKLLYLSIPKILVSFRTLFSGILAIRPLEPLFQRKSRH